MFDTPRSPRSKLGAGLLAGGGLLITAKLIGYLVGFAVGRVAGQTISEKLRATPGGTAVLEGAREAGFDPDVVFRGFRDSTPAAMMRVGAAAVGTSLTPSEQREVLAARLQLTALVPADVCARMLRGGPLPGDGEILQRAAPESLMVSIGRLSGRAMARRQAGVVVEIPRFASADGLFDYLAAHGTEAEIQTMDAGLANGATAATQCAALRTLFQVLLKAPGNSLSTQRAIGTLLLPAS